MTARSDLIHYLRDHIIGAMHVGQLRGGDRLPSIRDVARDLGRNTRTVRAAFAALEKEGLVEVRGRSGVFVARQEIAGDETSEETARWLSGVLVEAWKRRIAVEALPGLIERFTSARRVTCGLVDMIEDGIVALEHELEKEWDFDVRVIAPDAIEDTRDVDFFAATSFYAASIHASVEALAKPLVVLTAHPALKDALASRVREGSLTVVAVDPRFADRIRVGYSADDPSRVRFVAADDRKAVAALDPQEPVLLTRAARRKLGNIDVPMIFPHSPTISPESARLLAAMRAGSNRAGSDAATARPA
ncbi:MAG TPA: GntR family transcriptional regulator [Longimicrobiales bacterium]|nr:GntR family transcriptional regulator [Longimicrobiales bacterium]